MDIITALERCQHLENLARPRFKPDNGLWISIDINGSSFAPFKLYFIARDRETESFYAKTSEELAQHLDDLEAKLLATPLWEDRMKQIAVEKLGKAIDECKDVGIDMEAFQEPFAQIWDNLLPAPEAA